MLKLQFKDRRREAVWLVDQCFTIGKDASNSLMIDDARLAPSHAELRNQNQQLLLVSKTGGTGVWVNGMPVSDEVPVKAGDSITLGDVELELIDPKNTTQVSPQASSSASGWSIHSKASWLEKNRYAISDTVVIGRDPGCDICIPLDHLSRRHLELSIRGGQLFAKDLESSNGTFVNGGRITETSLKSGDKIKLDVVTFEVSGPNHDPHKTIIRQAPAPASATHKNTQKPPSGSARTQKKNSAARAKPATNKLVADGKQEWLKKEADAEPAAPEKSASKGWLIACVVLVLAGAAAWFML